MRLLCHSIMKYYVQYVLLYWLIHETENNIVEVCQDFWYRRNTWLYWYANKSNTGDSKQYSVWIFLKKSILRARSYLSHELVNVLIIRKFYWMNHTITDIFKLHQKAASKTSKMVFFYQDASFSAEKKKSDQLTGKAEKLFWTKCKIFNILRPEAVYVGKYEDEFRWYQKNHIELLELLRLYPDSSSRRAKA